jgi:hypothetical protein
MAARGAKLWLFAELDGVRLRIRRALGLQREHRPIDVPVAGRPVATPRTTAAEKP